MLLLPCGAFSWWLQPQGEHYGCLQRGSHWHYRFRVRRVRYRGALPEARTKWEAEQAESKIKQEIFEGRFGLVDLGSEKLADFINKIFLPWSKQISVRGDTTYFAPGPSATILAARLS